MMNIGGGGIFVFYLSRPTDPANYIISNYLVAYFMGFGQNIFEHGHNSTLFFSNRSTKSVIWISEIKKFLEA